MSNKVTIDLDNKLDRKFEAAWGLEPLSKVVEQAVKVLNPGSEETGRAPLNGNWIACIALRAVAEAIVREGHLPTPLRVDFDFAGFEDGYQRFSDDILAGLPE